MQARLPGVPPPNKSRLPQPLSDNVWSLKIMTLKEDCSSGRSQDLTCASEETVTLDRKTFDEIYGLIGDCVDVIADLQRCEIFITSTERCLMEMGNLGVANNAQLSKIILLLESWLKVVPQSQSEMYRWLQQANAISYQVLAPIKLGKSNG
jgi:hypothetical protein